MASGTVVITGASSGIGAEFARACAGRGEKLALVARRKQRLEALAAEIGGADVVPADLSMPAAAAALMAEIEHRGLTVGTLINNAGFGLLGPFADQSPDRLREMIAVNITALMELTRLIVPQMIENGGGRILNVASTAAFQAGPGMAVYFATKAFVLSFSEALHQELKQHRISVTALCPGKTATEFSEVAHGGPGSERFSQVTADVASVVEAGLKGLDRNQAIVIPGLVNKFTAQSNRIMPRAVMRRIVAGLKL